MKGIKLDARSLLAGSLVGSLVGCGLGYVLARSRARREYDARLDQAVAEVKAHYTRPIFSRGDVAPVVDLDPKRPRWAEVVADTISTLNTQYVPDGPEGRDDGSLDLEPADEDPGGVREGEGADGSDGLPAVAEGAAVGPGEPDGPFQITEAAFGELADEGFQTISVTFFVADKVLVDDKESPIRDMLGTIGTKNPKGFPVLEDDDPQIRYVRNRRLEVDFEILLDARSFAETVLGYGQPNKRREASPAATDK